MDEQKSSQKFELWDCEIARVDRLTSLKPTDAHTDLELVSEWVSERASEWVSEWVREHVIQVKSYLCFLQHRHVICPVANCQSYGSRVHPWVRGLLFLFLKCTRNSYLNVHGESERYFFNWCLIIFYQIFTDQNNRYKVCVSERVSGWMWMLGLGWVWVSGWVL